MTLKHVFKKAGSEYDIILNLQICYVFVSVTVAASIKDELQINRLYCWKDTANCNSE